MILIAQSISSLGVEKNWTRPPYLFVASSINIKKEKENQLIDAIDKTNTG
jgi:hypothetical protein